ncbi:cob(I)yrinic acid a,c-diamide adenosyltransferase [Ruminiclostridium cellulolyticum]|uniref:ATP:corrinoid adenosyltransferase BtuR/CobO/CobP n=1 Tax=Ruminiclostridium cellulolyticum (strain ATCC 35319 / DSM 5812 / JCM 6584 / H10) TaxID=394503 RepID=B8I189_RUMCH|nr:cob(I)yrinic acid a,c-diamide adenosyltransferase [Ruminiclostridium cellulolyticum]ACL75687.1 ATP:corrinoid adenosyltransferase BtuR/CobO/CobP [Ruminiclostridium cellulolyticum H10]
MGRKGLVHIYTGDGKGKTTAAIGLGVRACGDNMKVLMVQFLKSRDTCELHSLKKLEPEFTVLRGFSCKKFVWNMTEEEMEEARKEATEIFLNVKNLVLQNKYDLVILDELIGVLTNGFIKEDDVIAMIKDKPQETELVLTGRNAGKRLIEAADYVSDIKAVKHPYQEGISARKGIEF